MTEDHVFPEDEGTGALQGDRASAANFASYAQHANLSNYIESGLSIQNVDYFLDEFDLTAGKVFIKDDQADTGQNSKSRDQGVLYVAEVSSRTNVSFTRDEVNEVYISLDLTSDDTVTIDVRSDGSTPNPPFLKIAEIDDVNETLLEINNAPKVEVREIVDGDGVSHTGRLLDASDPVKFPEVSDYTDLSLPAEERETYYIKNENDVVYPIDQDLAEWRSFLTNNTVYEAVEEPAVAWGGEGNTTTLNSINSNSLNYSFTENKTIGDVTLSESYLIYGVFGGDVYVRDPTNNELIYSIAGGSVVSVGVDEQSGYFVYVTSSAQNPTAYVHNLSDGSLEYTLTESSDQIDTVSISNSYVVYGNRNGEAYVHNLSDGSLKNTIKFIDNEFILGVSITDTHVVVCGFTTKEIIVNDPSDGSNIYDFTTDYTLQEVSATDTQYAYVTGDDSYIVVRNFSDNSVAYKNLLSGDVNKVEMSGSYFAAADESGVIYTKDLSDGDLPEQFGNTNDRLNGVGIEENLLTPKQ